MHCNALYSFAAAALLAVSVQAAPHPAPSAGFPQASGVFKRVPQGTGAFQGQAQATGAFHRRQAQGTGAFPGQAQATGAFGKRQAPQGTGAFPGQAQATGAFNKRQAQGTGAFQGQAQATGAFNKRQAPGTAVVQAQAQATGAVKRSPQGTAVFKREPQATGSSEAQGEAAPPFPRRDVSDEDDSATTASCSSDGGKHPVYTISIPSDIASSDAFGSGCPASGFIDAMHSAGEPLLGYGCQENTDGGITITFTSAGSMGSAVDSALTTLSEGQFSQSGLCDQADGSTAHEGLKF